jgi:hypothetical protein
MRFAGHCAAIAAGILVAIAQPLSARTIVVPKDYRSIQGALNESQRGDTVFVHNGTYRESIVMIDGVVLLGEDVDGTIIRGDRGKPVVQAANRATIMNFTIERGGIGILSENTNMIIQRNVIRENDRTGVHCLIALPHIRNNVIAGNGWSGVFCELISYSENTAVEHNIISENGNSGVMLANKCGVLVQNNVFYQNKQYALHVSENSRRSRIIYNCFFANRRPYNYYAVVDETNIAKDPRFPVPPGSSFKLVESHDSPLRRLGKNDAPIGLVSAADLERLRVDTDGDGVADTDDLCVDAVEDNDGFEDRDGCPDFDNDFDGIYDTKDGCPDKAEDFDGFNDTDGCPDPDNDRDGIADEQDRCPNKAETANQYKDDDGCPDEKPR